MPRFTVGKPYWMVPFAIFIGFFIPIPFWLLYRFSTKGSKIARFAEYINTPILTLYIGYLPYSVNGQWWYVQPSRNLIIYLIYSHRSCVLIGFASQWWARTRRPRWFKKYNYLTSAALDGGSQVILFILVRLKEMVG